MNPLKSKEFFMAASIVIITIILMVANNVGWIQFGYLLGPYRLNHWLVWLGTVYIALIVPTIAVLKKRKPNTYMALSNIHIFGNLIAFLLISIHFTSQISRPATAYPDLGTGLALYIIIIFLVATGFIHRFQIIPQIKASTRKFIHVAMSFSFYIIIVIHILHGTGLI